MRFHLLIGLLAALACPAVLRAQVWSRPTRCGSPESCQEKIRCASTPKPSVPSARAASSTSRPRLPARCNSRGRSSLSSSTSRTMCGRATTRAATSSPSANSRPKSFGSTGKTSTRAMLRVIPPSTETNRPSRWLPPRWTDSRSILPPRWATPSRLLIAKR